MMTTYLNPSDFENYSKVSDKELNDLFQEVRQKFKNSYLLSERKHKIKKWFKKDKEITTYTLYFALDNIEVQVINFCLDHDWSLNTGVTRSYIFTYFYGLLNGLRQR